MVIKDNETASLLVHLSANDNEMDRVKVEYNIIYRRNIVDIQVVSRSCSWIPVWNFSTVRERLEIKALCSQNPSLSPLIVGGDIRRLRHMGERQKGVKINLGGSFWGSKTQELHLCFIKSKTWISNNPSRLCLGSSVARISIITDAAPTAIYIGDDRLIHSVN